MEEYSGFKVMPTVQPNVPARQSMSPGMAAIPGEQLEKYGDAEQKASITNQETAYAVQDALNQVKVLDARNQAMQAASDLRFNPESGFARLKGADALKPIEGQAMPDYYAGQLNQKMQQIGAGLTNPMQQRMFQAHAGEVMTSFKTDAESHMLGEYKDFHISAIQGAAELSANAALVHADNPALHDRDIEDMRKAMSLQSTFNGKSALELQSDADKAESSIRYRTLDNMILAGNVSGATKYYQANQSKFIGNDKLEAQTKFNDMTYNVEAMGVAMNWQKQEAQRINPTPYTSYRDALLNAESGGRDYGADGKPLRPPGTGADGSMYKYQVKPSTAKDPGFGIAPAKDDSAEEYNRVGEQLMQKLLAKYPDKDMATAAYHDGSGAVDKAIAQAGADGSGNWEKYLSSAARDEIVAVNQRMGANLKAQPMKSKEQANSEAIAALGPDATPVQVNKTLEMVDKYYGMLKTDQDQRGDQLWGKIQQQLMSNGGDMTKVDPIERQNLAILNPGASLSIERFAQTMARGGTQIVNTTAFADVYANPDKYRAMSQPELVNFLQNNFPKPEQEKVVEMLSKKAASQDNPKSFNDTAFKEVLTRHLVDLGIDAKDKTTAGRINDISTNLIQAIYEQQAQTGKKMQPKEIEDFVSSQFLKTAPAAGGWFSSPSSKKMYDMTPGDLSDKDTAELTAAYAQRGITPTPSDLMNLYWYRKEHGK